LVQSRKKVVSKFELPKHSVKGQSGTKSSVKPTWSEKMTVLSTVFKFSLNFLFGSVKKHYKIWYSQGEKWCQSLNCKNTV